MINSLEHGFPPLFRPALRLIPWFHCKRLSSCLLFGPNHSFESLDQVNNPAGIRLEVQEMTRFGMKEPEITQTLKKELEK